MHRVIYADSYFFLNFLMDGAALLITARVLNRRLKWYRPLCGALLGAAAALLPLFLPPPWGISLAAAAFLPMDLLTFGFRRFRSFSAVCLFQIAASLVLGGAVEALYWYTARADLPRRVTPGIFLGCLFLGLGAFTLWGRGARRRLEEKVVGVTIRRGTAQADLYALVDSGLLLREPISGDPVILLKAADAAPLFTPAELSALSRGDGDAGLPLLAIPVKTAAGGSILFGFRPTVVGLHHKAFRRAYRETDRAVVALDFSEGAFAGCPCLVPLSMV